MHVDFTSVRASAIRAGFSEVGETTQAEFLRNLGLGAYREALVALEDVKPAVRAANVHSMDTLVDREGMGSFKVVVLAKGVPDAKLTGFVAGIRPERVSALLAGASHMPLPGVGQDMGEMPTWDQLLR